MFRTEWIDNLDDNLTQAALNAARSSRPLPFSVIASRAEQVLFNAPVVKPTLICVLQGEKRISPGNAVIPAGSFLFLPACTVDMRNTPANAAYCALLLEFEARDFEQLAPPAVSNRPKWVSDRMGPDIRRALAQLIDWSSTAPPELWGQRRVEILHLLRYHGHEEVLSLAPRANYSSQVLDYLISHEPEEHNVEALCAQLAVSESTLRRRLAVEGSSLQTLKDQARMGRALGLLQTTQHPIATVAELCGYQSASRFAGRFKRTFGLTPRALRRTLMGDSG